jgi:hypothetical protein
MCFYLQVTKASTITCHRLTKLAKEHGVPLWEEAPSTAGDSDAESFGQPVSTRTCYQALCDC